MIAPNSTSSDLIRTLFVNPPYKNSKYSRASRSPAVTKSGTLYYPIWLAYAGANADAQEDIEVLLLDGPASNLDTSEIAERARVFAPHLVVLDTSTPSIHEDILCASAIKAASPQSFVALMGNHASSLPEETLALDPGLDAVIHKEADETVVELARALRDQRDLKDVEGLIYRQGDEIHRSPERPLIQDLDALPMISPFYDKHLNVEEYFFAAARFPMVMIMTSRGCPFKCSWCVYPQVFHQKKFRMRSPEHIAAEFRYIREHMPHIQEVGIEDDLFTGSLRQVDAVCDLLIAEGNTLPWWVDTRVNLPYETMEKMKQAGCRLLIAGFESGDQQILDNISKGTQLEEATTFMANARKLDFIVHGCFVFGQPGETFETMNKTLDLAKNLNPDTAQFFPMMIYPGTEAYLWAQSGNHMITQNFDHWLTPDGLHKSLITTPEFEADEVTRFCDHARRSYYLRPQYIAKKAIQSLWSREERRRNFKAFRTLIRFLFRKPELTHEDSPQA